MAEIRRIVRLARIDEDALVKSLADTAMSEMVRQKTALERSIAVLRARDAELDRLFESIHEDKVNGLLSADRFAQLSKRYEDDQHEARAKVDQLEEELHKLEGKSLRAEDFVGMAKQSKEIKRLTPKLLNQFIDWIEIHQAEKINGVYRQRIDIHFNCVGNIQLSEEVDDIVPIKEVSLDTRKGVKLTNSLPKELIA